MGPWGRAPALPPSLSSEVLRNPGFANKARLARRFALDQGALLVEDASDIPDERVYHHRHSCSELHPGLCARDDGAVYSDTLLFAKSMEACLHSGSGNLYKFLGLEIVGVDGVQRTQIYYFARLKRRKFHSQVTHCMVNCVQHANSSSGALFS
eukprot:1340229-Pyramimonas_sp.AAC.1